MAKAELTFVLHLEKVTDQFRLMANTFAELAKVAEAGAEALEDMRTAQEEGETDG